MRAIHFLYEEQQLDEVAMNPNALKTMANQVGATAGMEFEMIVSDMNTPDEDTEYENDMNSDERASSWGGIEDFFMSGDGNNYRPDVRTMIDKLKEDYWEWVSEVLWERWSDEGREYFNHYAEDEFDEDAAIEEALEELSEENPEITPDDDRVIELVKEKKQEWLDSEWDEQGSTYENAREAFEEDERSSIDEGDWLDSNYRWMSDIWENFGSDNSVYWPYQVPIESDNSDLGDLADDYSRAVGRGVNTSTTYHGVRNDNEYTIEPDGSLDPDSSDDAGLEFVSPPLPLEEMVKDLQKTVAWAKARGCYTNTSTGLHMNVSVPNYSFNKLDYVKLALLLGDEYILKEFGRSANGYAKSAMSKIREKLPSDPSQVQTLLQQMKNGMAQEASKAIHAGHTDKYTSINTKTGYIEFRSPGGNWLEEDLPKLINTLYRFVVALDAACDPEKYKEDYYKKLYKLLNPDNSADNYSMMINDFSKYVTAVGGAPQKVVADFRRLALATLQQSQGKETGKWWYNVAINGQRLELVADSPEHAWAEAVQDNPHWGRMNKNDAKITRLRPFVDNRPANGTQAQASAGEPQILRQEPNYYILDSNTQRIVNRYYAPDSSQAFAYLQSWRQRNDPSNEGNYIYGRLTPEAEQRYSQPQQRQTQYEIFRRDTNDTVVMFLAPDDEAALARTEQYQQTHRDRQYGVRHSRVQPRGI